MIQGLTRGDGAVGEDIQRNLRTIDNLPLRLSAKDRPIPELVEVRGEVLINRKAFVAFNAEREARGEPILANPRNATSGALRRNDPAEVDRYPLEFHTYAAPRVVGATFATQAEQWQALRDWGLPDSGYSRCVTGIQACLDYHGPARPTGIQFARHALAVRPQVRCGRGRFDPARDRDPGRHERPLDPARSCRCR